MIMDSTSRDSEGFEVSPTVMSDTFGGSDGYGLNGLPFANITPQCTSVANATNFGTEFEAMVCGYIYPVLALIVIFTNSNGIAVILKMQNFTQTNILLLGIFFVDLVTTIVPLPFYVYAYLVNRNEAILLRYPWCFLSYYTVYFFPIVTNNISIWLVALLSIQRCLCVRNRHLYERWFSRKRLILFIVAIACLAFSFHSFLMIGQIRFPQDCVSDDGDVVITLCNENPVSFVMNPFSNASEIANTTYYALRILLFHILPIVGIASSTALLIFVLYQAQSRIDRLKKLTTTTTTASKAGAAAHHDHHRFDDMISNAQTIKDQLEMIEEDEYRNASANLSDRRRTKMGKRLRRISKATTGLLREKRHLMLRHNKSVSKDEKKQRVATTTHMLVAISTIYLIQHLFQTILFSTHLIINATATGVMEEEDERDLERLQNASIIANLAYIAGYPAAFLLCMAVQEPFRQMFYSFYEDASRCCRDLQRSDTSDLPEHHLQDFDGKPRLQEAQHPVNSPASPLSAPASPPLPPEADNVIIINNDEPQVKV